MIRFVAVAAFLNVVSYAPLSHGQSAPVERQTSPPEAAVVIEGPSAIQTLRPEDVKPPQHPSPSFQARGGTRAGGPASELNTGDERASAQLPGGSATDALTGKDLYHGNYCGKGDRGAGLAPIDELDAACQRHDACYDKAGRASCACDDQLRRDALGVSEIQHLSREARARAASVAEAATVMSCTKP